MSTKFELEGVDYTCLRGKSALIIGGATTSGLETGLTLAKAGARVTIADSASHVATVSTFRSHGLAVQYVKCDVTSWSQQLMAFKQAIQFAPNRNLDIVCSFLAIDRGQNLVRNVNPSDSRIDVDPIEPIMDEIDINVKAACHLTKLAMHFFKLPDRVTAIKRARSRSGSSATSYTASSVHSRANSRSGSRRRSRSRSPVPVTDLPESGEALVVTEEPEQKEEAKEEDKEKDKVEEKPEDKESDFTKSIVLVCGFSAYVDDGHSNFQTASSFALRGLFRSVRAKCKEDLNIRVNLVSTWQTRDPMNEATLAELEKVGIIEREDVNGTAPDSAELLVNGEPEATVKASDETTESTVPAPTNDTNDDEQKDTTKEVIGDGEASTSISESKIEADVNEGSGASEGPIDTTNEQTGAGETVSTEESSTLNSKEGQNGQNGEIDKEKLEPETADQVNGSATKTPIETSDNADSEATPALVKYKNMYFSSKEDIAGTVTRLCSDSTISGRAIAVMPEGAFDLNDDHEGGYAGEAVKTLLNKRKEMGDVFCKIFNLVPDPIDVSVTPSPPKPES